MSESPRILYCRCAYAQVLPPAVKNGVLEGLCAGGAAFDAVADLCEMSARRDERLAAIAAADGPLKIAACHPRAVKWLFHAAGVPLPESTEFVNLRAASVEDALAQLRSTPPSGSESPPAPAAAS
jgi:hypothetical protein